MNLWYGSDEVREFHPIVEACLNDALKISGLHKKYEIKHHYGTFTAGIPDFVLLDKVTKDFVCIIEVKKTPSDVFYFGSGYQTKGYVDELYPLRWKPGFLPHFCVTNIEITQFFCLRENASLIGCLLVNSPHDAGRLEESDLCLKFTNLFAKYFSDIDSKKTPEYSMHLEAISESFNETFYGIAKILGVNLARMDRLIQTEEEIKESIIYELLRFAFYYYIKESYSLVNSALINNFPEFEVEELDQLDLVNLIENNFKKAMEIDFKDILTDFKSPNAIIPEKIKQDKELSQVFNNFIQTLRDNAPQGIKKNQNLLNFVSLLTSELFDKTEMHDKGKIMSDETLSNVLAEFAISDKNDEVIDPCCGDGNLLIAAYEKINRISKKTHNELLSQLTGIDIDANLIQLAAFKLICSNLNQVNRQTLTKLSNNDLFGLEETDKYDALVMNPPFLRNEDIKLETKTKYLSNLEKVTENPSFISNVSQPNIYFYFIEKAISLLKKDGTAAIILMTKFLNNKDGYHLKNFLLPHLNTIISYPPDFFEGFRVTTCIVVLSKNNPSEKVSFLNVKNSSILSNLEEVKKIISEKKNKLTKKYTLVNIKKSELCSESNWRLYLIDPSSKFEKFEKLEFLSKLDNYFEEIKRGKADNCGGSSIVYPYSSNNPLKEKVDGIEPQFLCQGLQRNKLSGSRRKIILTNECLEKQRGILISKNISEMDFDNYLEENKNHVGLCAYITAARDLKIKGKTLDLKKILKSSAESVHEPKILLPRADRIKHIVYYNPNNNPVLVSTNFFFLKKPINLRSDLDGEMQIKFIVAFLNSVFGQVQFEIHANNQEGLRKIEGFMIEKLKVLDISQFSKKEIRKVVSELEALDSKNIDSSGLEENGPRENLDQVIGKIIFDKNNLGFENSKDLTKFFQQFCRELIMDRVNKNG